jgi:hypothetical protein
MGSPRSVVRHQLRGRHPRFESFETSSPQSRELAILGPQCRIRVEEDRESEGVRDLAGDGDRDRLGSLPRESPSGTRGSRSTAPIRG